MSGNVVMKSEQKNIAISEPQLQLLNMTKCSLSLENKHNRAKSNQKGTKDANRGCLSEVTPAQAHYLALQEVCRTAVRGIRASEAIHDYRGPQLIWVHNNSFAIAWVNRVWTCASLLRKP